MSFLDLTGRIAVVTGGAQGIGMGIVRRLAKAGACVAIADINISGAKEVVSSLIETGATASAFTCDVSDVVSVNDMIIGVLNVYNQIDILINNAGIVRPSVPIQNITDEDWDKTLAIDLTGVFYCCRAVIPHMIKRHSGRIVNIASIAGKEGNLHMIAYSAAKAGVIALTKALAKEVAQHNIFVNAVTPGLISTTLIDNLSPEQINYYTNIIPLKRIGRPEDVAMLVHWLVSDDCSFSTGAVFDLTGGRATY